MPPVLRATAVLIALLTMHACGDQPTAPSPNPPLVRGTVLDFQTQTPISGAVVRLGTNPVAGGSGTVTDANGRYSLPQPPDTGRFYYFSVNNLSVGYGHPGAANYRGDLLVDTGTCVARYGVVMDARTLRPIGDAAVGFVAPFVSTTASTTTSDGWYRIDLGCPSSGTIGFNTTFISASHPRYTSKQQIVGRGIQRVQRLDLLLEEK